MGCGVSYQDGNGTFPKYDDQIYEPFVIFNSMSIEDSPVISKMHSSCYIYFGLEKESDI